MYFPDRPDLHNYIVRWSNRRQKRVLGSCNMNRRIVTVAKELNVAECQKWLEPLLYHEMCHAVLERSVSRRGRKMRWHGPEFKALELRHPGIIHLDAWIRGGGWKHAVQSNRASAVWAKRRSNSKPTETNAIEIDLARKAS